MRFYDWRRNHLLINGVEVTGWTTGDDVLKIERMSPAAESEAGVDGTVVVSLNADKRVKVTIKISQTSPTNALLSKLSAAQDRLDTLVPVSALWQDNYRNDSATTTLGYIEKHADINRGGKANVAEWVMVFANGLELLGAPTFAGLATLAAEALGA